MIKKVVASGLFALGTVIFIFFEDYKGSVIPYPTLIWLSAFVMYGAGLLLLGSALRSGEMQVDKAQNDYVKEMKTKGAQVKVVFTDCEIKQHNYVEEQEKYGNGEDSSASGFASRIKALDALVDKTRNTTRIQINQTVLIYKTNLQGSPVAFVSEVLPQDRATLMFKLDFKKETIVYVNKQNPADYFFDMDFLEANS